VTSRVPPIVADDEELAPDVTQPAVTIFIASIGTKRSTELCIRSIHLHTQRETYRIHVCDCGSEDGSLPMFQRMLRTGVIDDLTLEPRGRPHGEWLDWWAAICPTAYAIALDSDIEILSDHWLDLLLSTAREKRACMVTSEFLPEMPGYVDHTGVPRRLARRPSPWMMLFDPEACRELASWRTTMVVDASIPEGWWGLDTGAAVLRALEEQGLVAAEAPRELRDRFRHYGGMSWVKRLESHPHWRLQAKAVKVRALEVYVAWRISVLRFGAAVSARRSSCCEVNQGLPCRCSGSRD
jgi:hypothetical protein